MKYVLLIYDVEAEWGRRSEEERNSLFGEYNAFTNALRESGAYIHGEALDPVATATTLRVREGDTLTTDGPFAETKEQLAGFYLIDVESLDDALAWAEKIPAVRIGSIEVRPVMAMAGAPA